MYINHNIVKTICKRKGLKLGQALRSAGVSNTAYYSLQKKECVLPKSLSQLAETLGVPVSEILVDPEAITKEHYQLMKEVDEIVSQIGECDREVVKHSLLLLKESPIDRLRRGLDFGRIGHSN